MLLVACAALPASLPQDDGLRTIAGIAFVRCPPGEFTMGSGTGAADETPEHLVRVSGFSISRHEVTFGQYDRFCEETGRAKPSAGGLVHGNWQKMGGEASDGDFGWPRGDRPVINVSWFDARAFCAWLSAKTGAAIRLPTEAEWEYACRAGEPSPFPAAVQAAAWHRANSDLGTHPVMKKSPNAFGLYDMLGNVWEWCEDWYDPGYYAVSGNRDPRGPAEGLLRVVRGGSWINEPDVCSPSNRRGCRPDYRGGGLGFRVVLITGTGLGSSSIIPRAAGTRSAFLTFPQ